MEALTKPDPKLELKLGLPGEEDWSAGRKKKVENSSVREGEYRVIGWPPVPSFRKNIAESSSNQTIILSQTDKQEKKEEEEGLKKSRLVKVNMDGMPIGRKIDLEAHRSYDGLAAAIKELFRGLLTVRQNEMSYRPLDGRGEFTLIYEDLEGDVLLVGDVPWDMFVSGVKRLRVMKSSDLNSSLISVERKV